jgi:hypothetical protein
MSQDKIRAMVKLALADTSFCQAGILAVQLEQMRMGSSGRYQEPAVKTVEIDGYTFTTPADVVTYREGKKFKQSSTLITETDYQTSRWRRAILKLDVGELSWLLFCYGNKLNYGCQVNICNALWDAFMTRHKSDGFKKMNQNSLKIMRSLTFRCIQETRIKFLFPETPFDEYEEDNTISSLLSLSVRSWRKHHKKRWEIMKQCCLSIDELAMLMTAEKHNDEATSHWSRSARMPVQTVNAPTASRSSIQILG